MDSPNIPVHMGRSDMRIAGMFALHSEPLCFIRTHVIYGIISVTGLHIMNRLIIPVAHRSVTIPGMTNAHLLSFLRKNFTDEKGHGTTRSPKMIDSDFSIAIVRNHVFN